MPDVFKAWLVGWLVGGFGQKCHFDILGGNLNIDFAVCWVSFHLIKLIPTIKFCL